MLLTSKRKYKQTKTKAEIPGNSFKNNVVYPLSSLTGNTMSLAHASPQNKELAICHQP